jgi:AcrR family transcriptional regulator
MSITREPEARKIDPRVVRTRHLLREALVATILEKGYDATNIQDITDRAGLRRATFYLHYRDKEELLLKMMHDTLDELMQKMEAQSVHAFTPETQSSEDLLTFEHVQERADLYRAVLSGQGAAEITRGIRDYLAERIRENCARKHPDLEISMPIEVVANYLAAVKLNMVIWWLDSGMPYAPREMAEMCSRLAMYGAAPILEPFANYPALNSTGENHDRI